MSLFPAYANLNKVEENPSTSAAIGLSWLQNSSYIPFENPVVPKQVATKEDDDVVETVSLSSSSSTPKSRSPSPKRRKHKKKKDKKSKHHKKDRHKELDTPKYEFTGTEKYYVDKKSNRSYLTVQHLQKTATPRYRITCRLLGTLKRRRRVDVKRYYQSKWKLKTNDTEENQIDIASMEDEFTNKTRQLNIELTKDSNQIKKWIELIHLQNSNPMRCTKVQLAERKIDILDRALRENPSNDELYEQYVTILNSTFPSFEVSKYLDKLITKDQSNYLLWSAQIMASQGSMARCIVPDVLKLYEECMKKMFRKTRQDDVILKLFSSCAFFLRQCGLMEQFFALIKLALDLNVSANKFSDINPLESDQHTLVEYEEVVLSSGLPMNEIWLRIEKLRQNFNFLPVPENTKCNDPQRMVFNEDICYFIYPITNRAYTFDLILIILRTLKIPLPINYFEHTFLHESKTGTHQDAIEEILQLFLYKTFWNTDEFDRIVFDFVKDLNIGPSYITSNIASEIFLNVVNDILLRCTESIENNSKVKHALILIWMRFQRILIRMDTLAGKPIEAKRKSIKNQIKGLLSKEENRNVLSFYTEYALIEYEFCKMKGAEGILQVAINQSEMGTDDCLKSEYVHAMVVYAELLIIDDQLSKALDVLMCYTLNHPLDKISSLNPTEARKLLALKKIDQQVEQTVFIEKNVEIMELEQYFHSDLLLSLIKAKVYLYALVKSKHEALEIIERLLKIFTPKSNDRHRFINEQLYELFMNVSHFPHKYGSTSQLGVFEKLQQGIDLYPGNYVLLKEAALFEGHSWYKIRSLLTRTLNTPWCIVFLVMSAKYRLKKYIVNNTISSISSELGIGSDLESSQAAYKLRVSNLLKAVLGNDSICRKNAILWRLYMRSLSDTQASFEECKNVLYRALDECPWNKSLYLDATVYVPQEISQIQDLLIEKQLRIYALPEELEILRNDDAIQT